MKRISKFMMALVMIFSMSISAFAAGGAGEGSITITNATEGETYSVYKIFDAVYEGDKVAYTLNNGTLEGYMFGGSAVDYGADIGEAADFFEFDPTTKVVTLEDGADQTKLFKYLGNLVKDDRVAVAAAATITAGGDTVEFTDLDTGYYVINRANGNANGVTITTTKPHADVVDKNRLPSDLDKTSDKDSVSVGDTINWTLKLTASNYNNGEKIVSYTIWDRLTPAGWAEIDTDTIKVFVDDTAITEWRLVNDDTFDFKINIPWVEDGGEFKYAAVTELRVTYSATVKAGAAAKDPSNQENKNTADFEWDTESTPNVPGDGDETDTEVYNLGFTKVDGTTNAGLAGAEFDLYRMEKKNVDGVETDVKVEIKVKKQADGLYIVAPDGTDKIVSPDGGKVVIQGLAAGTYYLTEVKAPDGYNKLDTVVTVIIAADPTDSTTGEVTERKGDEITIGDGTYYVNNAELNIENNSGVELPSTGGKGTIMMITFGAMVAMAFAVLLITQKKMSIYHD